MTVEPSVPVMPFARGDVLEVPPIYRALRGSAPVTRVRTLAGDLAWLVTRHDDVRALFVNPALGRSHPEPERAARVSQAAVLGGPMGDTATERDEHNQMRMALNRSFSARRMELIRPKVEAIVSHLLGAMREGEPPVDLHEALSFPLPVFVICDLLGVPVEDREEFRQWSNGMLDMRDGRRSQASQEALGRYMRGLLERKRSEPAEDVLTDLVEAQATMPLLTNMRIIGIATGLLFAGHETTVTRIDYGTLLLLTNPEQRDRLQRDPGLAPQAVEEILRMSAPGEGVLPRYATADVRLGDVTIAKGDLVLLATASANRDDDAFPDADRFDITRDSGSHVAFGHGPRFCLGASLARVELQSVFSALFQRFPTLRLAVPLEELRRREHLLTGGLVELPVAW